MCAAILFIDDYEPASVIMQFIVEDMGHRFFYAPNGADALKQARESHIDLALVDIHLPHMQGHDLAQQLRKNAANKDMCLVAFTADARGVSKEMAKYFDAVEQKSLNASETEQFITRALCDCKRVA